MIVPMRAWLLFLLVACGPPVARSSAPPVVVAAPADAAIDADPLPPSDRAALEAFLRARQDAIAAGKSPDSVIPGALWRLPEFGARLAAADRAWAAKLGPLAVEVTGDGTRVPGEWVMLELATPGFDLKDPPDDRLNYLHNYEYDYKKFESNVRKLIAKNPAALRPNRLDEIESEKRRDELTEVLDTIAIHARYETMLADYYLPPLTRGENETGCGVQPVVLAAERQGRGWGPWMVDPQSPPYGEHAECGPLPADHVDSPALLVEWKALVTEHPDEVHLVQKSKISINQPNMMHDVAYKTVELEAHGRVQVRKYQCGAAHLHCELDGTSIVVAANAMLFYLERAEVHRKHHERGACQTAIARANRQPSDWRARIAEWKTAGGDWNSTDKYQFRDGSVVAGDDALVAKLDELHARISAKQTGYCE